MLRGGEEPRADGIERVGSLDDALEVLALARPKWIWLVDRGVETEPQTLDELLQVVPRMRVEPKLLASKVLRPDGSLDPWSLPVLDVHRPDRVIPALEQRMLSLRAARVGSLLINTEALARLDLLSARQRWMSDLEWTAHLLQHEYGVLVPKSVAVRVDLHRQAARPGGPGAWLQMASGARLLAALEPRERLWFIARLGEQGLSRLRAPRAR